MAARGGRLTLQQAVEGSFYGASYLSEIERGQRRMPEDLARHVDQVLGTDGFFGRRCEEVRKARTIGQAKYAERVLEAEKFAETIDEWCPTVFPGVLQTELYTRALFRAERPLEPQAETDVKVNARLASLSLRGRAKGDGVLGHPARINASAAGPSACGYGGTA